MRLIDADKLKIPSEEMIAEMAIAHAPTIEPNLILPERMERGDIYEVGETIVVMNHDDYYDLLCKSWEPKRGEWKRRIVDNGFNADWVCSECGYRVKTDFVDYNFCPNCGADMRK